MTSRNEGGQGDNPRAEDLFEHMYHCHYQAVQAYLFGRMGDHETALDLLQETFLRIWRHRETLKVQEASEQRAWIFTIARNALTDYYRRRARLSTVEERLARESNTGVRHEHRPDRKTEEDGRLRDLESAILVLPENLRTVLVMQVLGQLSSAQIAEALGKPAGTIRYQIAQARKHLANQLRLGVDERGREDTTP